MSQAKQHSDDQTIPNPTPSHAQKSTRPASAAEDAALKVDESLRELQRATEALSAEVSKSVRSTTEQGTTFVRENPGMALAGAVGVGVLVGFALRGRT